jgi:TrpR family transcriptional regulator, trp operon repressor
MSQGELNSGWNDWLGLLATAKSPAELDTLMGLFLTPEERSAIGQRFRIVQALLQGQVSQREMAKTLGVSISKITRGSNQLKSISPELKAYLQQMMT